MKGALPKFTNVHLWKALHEIYSAQKIGRKNLASKIGIGEGSIRTILRYLETKNFVTIKQTGIRLTEKGEKVFKRYKLQTLTLEKSRLAIGRYNCAVHVINKAHKIKLGIEQRDSAIKAGALGATTLIYRNNKFCFPKENKDLKLEYPKIIKILSSKFKIENNDTVIIGSANSFKKAEEGAIAAALDLLNFKL